MVKGTGKNIISKTWETILGFLGWPTPCNKWHLLLEDSNLSSACCIIIFICWLLFSSNLKAKISFSYLDILCKSHEKSLDIFLYASFPAFVNRLSFSPFQEINKNTTGVSWMQWWGLKKIVREILKSLKEKWYYGALMLENTDCFNNIFFRFFSCRINVSFVP